MSVFKLIQRGDYSIVLVREFPCETKEQLFAKERYYIEKYKDVCVNKNMILGSVGAINEMGGKVYQKKYRELNSKKIRTQKEKYYIKNKESITSHYKEKVECETCGKMVTRQNKARHSRSKGHLNGEKNKYIKKKI